MAKKIEPRTFSDYKVGINHTKHQGGQYWTNIVGGTLRMAAEELGQDEANRLIRECGLNQHGWREEDQ